MCSVKKMSIKQNKIKGHKNPKPDLNQNILLLNRNITCII